MDGFMPKKSASQKKDPVQEYLAQIGARGGKSSRRLLSKEQARMMVSIREALRAARKEGRTLSARERKRLAIPPLRLTRPSSPRQSSGMPNWGLLQRKYKPGP
jgi:hypothetical protein